MPGQSAGKRGTASVGNPNPRKASSNRRSISRCSCKIGLTAPPGTGTSLRCTGRAEEAVCCSSCSFLNQFQGANFLKSISMLHLQIEKIQLTRSPAATDIARLRQVLFGCSLLFTLAHHLLLHAGSRLIGNPLINLASPKSPYTTHFESRNLPFRGESIQCLTCPGISYQ